LLFNRDKMANAPRHRVAAAAVGTIDGVQNFEKAVQPLGMAAAFILLCEQLGVEPQDAFTMAKNVMVFRDSKNTTPEFMAVRDYIKHEVING
jgi:hypothetical protein